VEKSCEAPSIPPASSLSGQRCAVIQIEEPLDDELAT
jgi:hypothetical protein